MSLPTGTWNINGNGFVGQLNIQSVDPNGNVAGTMYNDSVQGFWDEGSQRAVLMRIPNAADPTTIQVYIGYLFQNNSTYTLAGPFQFFGGTGGVANRLASGWFAQKVA